MTPVAKTPHSSPAADPLAGLRGYHLPHPISWWPPAPGWWLLALLILVLVLVVFRWGWRHRQRRAAARGARAELARLRAILAQDGDLGGFARGLSRLLRRFALARFPHRQVAGLTGEGWLRFLDAHGGEGRFRQGPGRLLIEAPYRPSGPIPTEELGALVADWISRNADGGTGPRADAPAHTATSAGGRKWLPLAASLKMHRPTRHTFSPGKRETPA